MLDISTVGLVPVPKRSALDTSRRELSEHISFGFGTFLVVEQSRLEHRSLGGGDIHGRIRYHGEYIPGTSSRYYNRYEYTYRLFSLVVMPSVFLDCVKASKFQRLAGLSLFFSCAERHLIVYLASLNVRNGASEGEPCIPY